jgi:predicted MFS family arabinose efflux permease
MPLFHLTAMACLIPFAFLAGAHLVPLDEEVFHAGALPALARMPAVAVMMSTILVGVLAENACLLSGAAWAQHQAGATPLRAAWLATLFCLGQIVGRACAALCCRWLTEPLLLLVCAAGAGFVYLGMQIVTQEWLAGTCLFAAGFFIGPFPPLAFAHASRSASQGATAAMALCYLAASAGGIAGPTILGWVGQTWSLGIALAISGAAIWLLAGLPLAAYLRARGGQASPGTAQL